MKYTRESLKGKLIDAHTHAGISLNAFFDDKYPYCCSLIDVSQKVKTAGFDLACVFPFPSFVCGDAIQVDGDKISILRELTEKIPYKKAVKKILLEKDRFNLENILPFAMFSINYAINEQIDFLESVSSYIYGLKYYPDADAKKITELMDCGRPFIDYLIRHNMPLVIHTSENSCLYGQGYSDVNEAFMLAKNIPELRIVAAHMGHFSKKTIESVLSHNLGNFYYDVSPLLHICNIRTANAGEVLDLDYYNPQMVIKELLKILPDKLLWGSDMPFNFTCNLNNSKHNFDYESFSLEKNVNVLKSISKRDVDNICSKNIIDFLFGQQK